MRSALRHTHPLIAAIAFAALPLTLALALTLGVLFDGGGVRAATTGGALVAATATSTSAATTTLSTTATGTGTTAVPDITSAAAAVKSATVLILNLGADGTTQAAGTGFIIDASGLIVTNNHVVTGASSVKVQLPSPDGRTLVAQVVGTDSQTDLAVLRIDATALPTVTLGSSSDLTVGQWVVTVGNALALDGGPTVTAGIVSATGRDVEQSATASRPGQSGTSAIALYDLIQTDAAINEGDSGGPLVDLQGRVIGINTLGTSSAQSIGFAIPIDSALPIIQQLIENGKVTRATLGVQGQSLTPLLAAEEGTTSTSGVLVSGVQAGSGAATAGIRFGDVITAIGGTAVTGQEDLQAALLTTYKSGDTCQRPDHPQWCHADGQRDPRVTAHARPTSTTSGGPIMDRAAAQTI